MAPAVLALLFAVVVLAAPALAARSPARLAAQRSAANAPAASCEELCELTGAMSSPVVMIANLSSMCSQLVQPYQAYCFIEVAFATDSIGRGLKTIAECGYHCGVADAWPFYAAAKDSDTSAGAAGVVMLAITILVILVAGLLMIYGSLRAAGGAKTMILNRQSVPVQGGPAVMPSAAMALVSLAMLVALVAPVSALGTRPIDSICLRSCYVGQADQILENYTNIFAAQQRAPPPYRDELEVVLHLMEEMIDMVPGAVAQCGSECGYQDVIDLPNETSGGGMFIVGLLSFILLAVAAIVVGCMMAWRVTHRKRPALEQDALLG